jgi:hypothetical protein
MSHILPIKPNLTPAEAIAEAMIEAFNHQIDSRLNVQRQQYRAFWDSPIPPDDILVVWGSRAQMMLAAASENVEHLTKLCAFLGKQLSDEIPDELIHPRREFIPGENGTVTLAPPAPGHDAWGRAIPVEPEPEPEPQPEPQPETPNEP